MKVVNFFIVFVVIFLLFNLPTFAQTCNCKEYIYLNEPFIGSILKFEVGTNVALTEVLGINGGTPPTQHWYPGTGATELPNPHGLATDLNGRLYIGSDSDPNNPIRRFNCDGALEPLGPNTINNQFYLTNMFNIGNTIYTSRGGGPAAYNSCTGNLIDTMCLNDRFGNPITTTLTANWGLSYNATTEMVYVTGRGANSGVWVFTKQELESGIAGTTCSDILIPYGNTNTINIGDNFIPNDLTLQGIVSDNSGNIFISAWGPGNEGVILKYDANGNYLTMANNNPAFFRSYGIVWSETTNRIFVANGSDNIAVDCISAFDPSDLTYLGTAAPNPALPGNNSGKAIAIIKECCPVNLPSTFQREVCGAVGTKFYLNQEAFESCDGVVCGSSWTPVGTLTGMTFEPCDNSVTVTGTGCGTFTLNIGAITSTGCSAQASTFTICNTVPSATIATIQGTCSGTTPNNNAVINIIAAMNANQAGISTGGIYTGPAFNGVGTVIISGGSASFTNRMHNTQYTVRIFNGSNECYIDYIVTTPTINCVLPCSASITASPTPCNTTTNQYSVSGQVTFSNPPASGTLTVGISGGSSQVFNAPFASPINYTISGQLSDGMMRTVTATFSVGSPCTANASFTAPVSCVTPGSCNCKEYIYLNEPIISSVLKFEVGAGVPLTEVVGANGGTPPAQHWYPGLGTTELPSPHGLATDLNGRLYIGARETAPGQIRQLDCDGNISPVTGSTITNNNNFLYNMFSIGNTIYTTRNGKVNAYNSCSGALLGSLCFNNPDGTLQAGPSNWGLSYNSMTEMVYGTRREGTTMGIYAFNKQQLELGISGGPCIDPLITVGTSSTINVGDRYIPTSVAQIVGIVGDNLGNMYVVGWTASLGTNSPSVVLKYDANGGFVAITAIDATKYRASLGIVWSENTNRLYVANWSDLLSVDCISVFDPVTMTYLGAGAANPGLPIDNRGKALAIIKECCPVNLPSTFQREVCGAIGTKFYLNEEAFDLCDGIVCGSTWTPTDNNNSIMTFDPCDNSVVVNGNGCRTFTLNIGAVISTGCGAQNSTFTICNTVINASVNANIGTCSGPTPNNNASIVISNILNVNQAGISLGTIYNGPAYGAAGTISITSGGTFPNLLHNTYYTVRIFNGSNTCFFDRVILTPTIQCCNIAAITAINLECIDNGTPALITDNRIRFTANVTNSNALLTAYNVTINGGTTIRPNTNVPYGVTQFLLGPGTAGGGATFTIMVTDSVTLGCTQSFQVIDPGNCTPSTPSCPPIKCGTATIQVNGN